ncbi:hypothetical protein BME24068_04147 [Burkholderia metallica]|nr:hypothetical protein BME24068_04147 [Burkholderia metallica]
MSSIASVQVAQLTDLVQLHSSHGGRPRKASYRMVCSGTGRSSSRSKCAATLDPFSASTSADSLVGQCTGQRRGQPRVLLGLQMATLVQPAARPHRFIDFRNDAELLARFAKRSVRGTSRYRSPLVRITSSQSARSPSFKGTPPRHALIKSPNIVIKIDTAASHHFSAMSLLEIEPFHCFWLYFIGYKKSYCYHHQQTIGQQTASGIPEYDGHQPAIESIPTVARHRLMSPGCHSRANWPQLIAHHRGTRSSTSLDNERPSFESHRSIPPTPPRSDNHGLMISVRR